MFSIESVWFDMFIFSFVLLIGNILMMPFNEKASRYRKLAKTIIILILIFLIDIYFGKITAFIVLGLSIIPVLYIHAIKLPKNGINGWTAEPKNKYSEIMGWSKETNSKE